MEIDAFEHIVHAHGFETHYYTEGRIDRANRHENAHLVDVMLDNTVFVTYDEVSIQYVLTPRRLEHELNRLKQEKSA